jgi:hypothetical protein
MGNRVCAAFRVKLGLESSQAEDESETAKDSLNAIRKEYKRITDGVKKVTRRISIKSPLISDYGELKMIESYENLLKAEKTLETYLHEELKKHQIYNEFLVGIKGVGLLMAGVIVSEIDIHKCNSISALWCFSGLDVVVYTDKDTGEIKEEGRSRKSHHLVEKTYTNSDGKEVKTKGITFNPFLKTKLIGVLGSLFIKLRSDPYREIYDNYKHRLENKPKWIDRTKAHRNNAAIRYMIKEFLADLWTTWRKLEGLEVRSRYSEEKLGLIHSK